MANWPYNSPAWKTVRKQVLIRDRYRCQIGDKKCRGVATAVDHVIPFRDGGALFDMSNLRTACLPCNNGQRNKNLANLARLARECDERGRFTGRVRPTPSRDW